MISAPVLGEMAEVLAYPKLARYVTARTREAFLRRIARIAEYIEPAERIAVCRDPRDDKFIELAAAGGAACLVSGDQDLLSLGSFRGIPLLTPAQFLAKHG